MRLQVLGSGDAFGSGGWFHTCFEAKKVVLTHMSPNMLSRDRASLAGCDPAEDGMVIEIPKPRALVAGRKS
jgi:hypothetical protein